MGGNDKNGPNWCQTHCLGFRYMFFFLCVFICTNWWFMLCLDSVYCVEGMRRVRVSDDKRNGPKWCQTRCLGPRCVFFCFFFSIWLTKMGPKDVSHVVWAWSRRCRPLKPSSCCQKKRGNGANSVAILLLGSVTLLVYPKFERFHRCHHSPGARCCS